MLHHGKSILCLVEKILGKRKRKRLCGQSTNPFGLVFPRALGKDFQPVKEIDTGQKLAVTWFAEFVIHYTHQS
jgi:hypothetical protein